MIYPPCLPASSKEGGGKERGRETHEPGVRTLRPVTKKGEKREKKKKKREWGYLLVIQ